MKLYLSGPITGIVGYRENFASAEKFLNALGYDVVNPAELNLGDVSHEAYMKRDIKLLVGPEAIEGLVLLPGWVNSKGAVIEVVTARAIGMPIFQLFGHDLLEITGFSDAAYMHIAQTLRGAVK